MNILAVGAHFDDVDLGCAGSLAKHVKSGDKVYIYVATDSGYANTNKEIVRESAVAKKEGEKSAEIIGADLICGNHNALFLEFEEKVNVDLIKIIEQKKIDLIYAHWSEDVLHDHYNLAKVAMHAGRHVPRLLMYRSNWYISAGNFRKNFFVDISNTWDIKEKAMLAHESECGRTDNKWIEYFKGEALNNGLMIGVKYAEAFEMVKWLE